MSSLLEVGPFDWANVPHQFALVGLAFALCTLIGWERQYFHKAAGIRTHALVGLGSSVFTLISVEGFVYLAEYQVTRDPSRIAAQIVSGIGFLGAGVIFVNRDVVRGLTTAASIWLAAAIGMACGAGLLPLAVFATVLHFVDSAATPEAGSPITVSVVFGETRFTVPAEVVYRDPSQGFGVRFPASDQSRALAYAMGVGLSSETLLGHSKGPGAA